MFGSGWDPSSFQNAQRGVRVDRLGIEARLDAAGRLSCSADVSYSTTRGETLFLLNPQLQLEGTHLDGQEVPAPRSGLVVRLPDSTGHHQLRVRYAGSLPSDGGLGVFGNSFDLNGNVLWAPTFGWGSRLKLEVKIEVPSGAEVLFPGMGGSPERMIQSPSAIDATTVGGRIRSHCDGGGITVDSLVRDDSRALHRTVERIVAWQEQNWGPQPFGALCLVETWRQKAGAYARPGLVSTPDWTRLPPEALSQRLVHETTHQWWGMGVLPGEEWFSEDWLSEGFATYCEFCWLREAGEPEAADRFLATATKAITGLEGSLSTISLFSQEGWSLTRYGGLLTLLELEHRIPDLRKRLREFRARYHGTFVTTKALAHELSLHVPEAWLTEHLVESRTWPGDLRARRSS